MILRELFSRIVVDTKAALANVNKFDAALDDTSDGLSRVEDQTAKMGAELDKGAKKGRNFGSIVATAFKKVGRSAFEARGKIKDAAIGIAKGVASVGVAVGVATLAAGALTIAWANNAQELGNLSKTYQISTDDLQSFTGALKTMGLEADGGLEVIKELNIRMGEAKTQGATPFEQSLNDLGISLKSFSALPMLEQMGLLADRLSEVTDASDKNVIANNLAGDDMIKLLPLMDKRSAGIKDLIKKTKEFGLVQSKFAIKSGAELAKSWKFLLALGKRVADLVATKLEPAFSAIIATTTDWIQANDDLVAGGIADFIERLVNLGIDFLPILVKIIDGSLKVVEGIGSIDGAIITLMGTMAVWKLATSTLLGAGGPWVAGLTGIITLLAVVSAKLRAEDKNITRLGKRRITGLGFRRRGEFAPGELEQSEGGRRILELEEQRKVLIGVREATGVGVNIDESRKEMIKRLRMEEGLGALNSGGGFSSGLGVSSTVEDRVIAAKKAEKNIEANRLLIIKELELLRDQKIFLANRKEQERTKDAREAAARLSAENKVKRTRARELLGQFRAGDPKEFAKGLRSELLGLIGDLGLALPEGLELEAKKGPKGKKGKKKDREKTIAELVGLGPEGLKTIADIVPLGQGTTINHFNFMTTVQPARVEIEVNAPEGTSAVDIGTEVADRVGQAISDLVHIDQRELIGQLQG